MRQTAPASWSSAWDEGLRFQATALPCAECLALGHARARVKKEVLWQGAEAWCQVLGQAVVLDLWLVGAYAGWLGAGWRAVLSVSV
ncbi:MAG: hypothetical protein ACPG7W_08340 [Paracoccaceae bacterium]